MFIKIISSCFFESTFASLCFDYISFTITSETILLKNDYTRSFSEFAHSQEFSLQHVCCYFCFAGFFVCLFSCFFLNLNLSGCWMTQILTWPWIVVSPQILQICYLLLPLWNHKEKKNSENTWWYVKGVRPCDLI